MIEDSGVSDRIRRLLEKSELEYQVLPCDPMLADTEIFCEHYGYPLSRSANTIVVKAKTGGERFVACLVLADSRLDVNKTVRKRIKARRVSFASPEETRGLCSMELGGITPLGLPESLARRSEASSKVW